MLRGSGPDVAVATDVVWSVRVGLSGEPVEMPFCRVATNLENLKKNVEYSGIFLDVENSGNGVQPPVKVVTKSF